MILEEAEKLYNELTTELTNDVIAAAGAMRASSLPLPDNNHNQKLIYEIDNTYQTEESRYNYNQTEIYSNDQELPNE